MSETNETSKGTNNLSLNMSELVSETNTNIKKVKCLRCDSYILQPNAGVFTKLETCLSIPSMRQKKSIVAGENIEYELLQNFWLVNEAFTFENVGFTNTVNNKKYLICADCEIGPLGVQNLDSPNQFYLSLDRVKHV